MKSYLTIYNRKDAKHRANPEDIPHSHHYIIRTTVQITDIKDEIFTSDELRNTIQQELDKLPENLQMTTTQQLAISIIKMVINGTD
jgi:hypothetical protein